MLRRSSRLSSGAAVNYAALDGASESDHDEKLKQKRRKDDDDYVQDEERTSAGKQRRTSRTREEKKEEKEEEEEEEQAIDPFSCDPPPCSESCIYHVPRELISLIFSFVDVETLLSMRNGLQSLYFKRQVDMALSRMAVARFGSGADFRAFDVMRIRGSELLKGQSKTVFRLRDQDLEGLPKRVVRHFGHYAYEEHFYQVVDLIPVAIKRHGSLENLVGYQEKLRQRKQKVDERRGNAGVREAAIKTELESAGQLPSAVSDLVQKWIRLGTQVTEEEVKSWLTQCASIRSRFAPEVWAIFKDMAADACLNRIDAAAAVRRIKEAEAKRCIRQEKVDSVLKAGGGPADLTKTAEARNRMSDYFERLTVTLSDEAFDIELEELMKRARILDNKLDRRCPCGGKAAGACSNYVCFYCCGKQEHHVRCFRHPGW